MSSQNFNLSLKYVLLDEGGNDDDPQDHGGRTSRGITQREYDAWSKLNHKPIADVWHASDADVHEIYRSQYWNPYCDGLPSGLDYLFFDISVNAGRSRAVKSFQKALNLPQDGMLGQITLAAIHAADVRTLINQVSQVRRDFYRNLAQFPRFGKGWLNRVNHCEKYALAMAINQTISVKTDAADPESPKANEKDVAKASVSPETSGATAISTGGLLQTLDSFKDSVSAYAGDISYLKYALVAVGIFALGYSVWGFYKRSRVQAAL